MYLNWIVGPDGNTLCADGHPIRIRRSLGSSPPFTLERDGHPPMAYWGLTSAKIDAERFAAEGEEFAPSET